MDLNEVLDGLVHFGQYDWIPLWVIVQDAEDLVGVDDEDQVLETTVALARGLLQRGFRAGDGPLESAVRFHAWPNQSPEFIADFIRQQWARRDDFPDWGDGPWFALLPHSVSTHALARSTERAGGIHEVLARRLAIVAVAFLTVGIALLHRNIDRYINRIGKL